MATPVADPSPVAATPPSPQQATQQQQQQNVTYVVYQMPAPQAGEGTISIDWSNCFTFYVARGALVFFLWASWTIFIAGVAKDNKNCNDGLMSNSPYANAISLNTAKPPLAPTSAGDCVRFFALDWWGVWLQFTATIAVTATTFRIFAKRPYVKGIMTLTLFFIIMSNILMFFLADANNQALYWNMNKIPNPSIEWTISTSLELVGTITCLIFNFIYLIYNSYSKYMVDAPASAPAAAHAPAAPEAAAAAPAAAEGAKASSS